jgi:hypothetical protein
MKCIAKEIGTIGKGNMVRRVKPGEIFEAENCPKWATPADLPRREKPVEKAKGLKDLNGAPSEGYSVGVAVPLIEDMQTVDAVEKFVVGDKRDGIQKAAAKRIAEIKEIEEA